MIWFRPGVLMHPGTNFMIMCLKAARKEISIPFIDCEGKRIDVTVQPLRHKGTKKGYEL